MYFSSFVLFLIEFPVSKQCYAASDLGLHCLPRFQKRDSRLIWVNDKTYMYITVLKQSNTILCLLALKYTFHLPAMCKLNYFLHYTHSFVILGEGRHGNGTLHSYYHVYDFFSFKPGPIQDENVFKVDAKRWNNHRKMNRSMTKPTK